MSLRSSFVKLFPKSLWVYHVNVGACNGCDIEVINVLTPYYDAERFGIKLVRVQIVARLADIEDRHYAAHR